MKNKFIYILSSLLLTAPCLSYSAPLDYYVQKELNMELVRAVRTKNVKKVQLLLKQGADVNKITWISEHTVLQLAILNGNREIAQTLIESGANINAKNMKGETALITAAQRGDINISQLLIVNGAKLGSRTKDNWTALHWASVGEDNEKLSRLLLAHGAHLNVKNNEGNTPLNLATKEGHTSTVELFLKRGAKIDKRTLALATGEKGNSQIVQLLLDYGAKLNDTDVLHSAAKNNKRKTVQILLEHGADVRKKNPLWEYTALHLAADNGHVEIILDLLKNSRTDINAVSGSGATPLMLSVISQHIKAVQVLLEHGADVNAKDTVDVRGMTALMYAASKGSIDIVKLLLKHGADASILTRNGLTALKLAEYRNHEKIIEILSPNKCNSVFQSL